MIRGARVQGFKRFSDERFKFSSLTVLTGLNGSGKTSLMQAILLAFEASTTKSASLRLNGPFGLELGTTEEVLNWKSASPISIAFEIAETEVIEWRFAVPSEEALYLEIIDRPPTLPKAFSGAARTFTYLSAERLGPRGFLATSALPEVELEVGTQGEYCAHVLSVLGDRVIEHIDRHHPLYDGPTPRLLKYEVEQWLSEIARPIEVTGERAAGATIAELRFRSPGGVSWVRSTNMGFGITHALPIVLAGLIADAGGLLLVENPEAHLHPAGQSRMGVFLAWLAGRGVQTIIETHSDHIVNGIRRGIAEHEYLKPKSALLYSLVTSGRGTTRTPLSRCLSIGDSGTVSEWPKGFFDEYQFDVGSLRRLRRRRK